MMTTGRSLPSVGSSSNGTHVHTTSPGSGSPSSCGVYSMRTPVDRARSAAPLRRVVRPVLRSALRTVAVTRRTGRRGTSEPSGHRVRVRAVGQPTSVAKQVVVRSRAARRAGPSPSRDEHDRRARHLVVVRPHRVAVGAGDRHGQQVADGDVGRQVGVEQQHVARLAVLADDPRPARPLGVDRRGAGTPRSRCRTARAAGCRSCRRRRRRTCARRGSA